MALKREDVALSDERGTFGGYCAAPESGTGPGVLVVQEIFGVNAHIRAAVGRLAEAVVYVHPGAGQGFHGDARASSHASRARQAWQRPMEFFQKHLGV